MKSSGQAVVKPSINHELQSLIYRLFPSVAPATIHVLPLVGLSGYSAKVSLPNMTLLARHATGGVLMPGVDRQREYRILRKLRVSGLVPPVIGCNHQWLLLEWVPGEVLNEIAFTRSLDTLVARVVDLHRQPLTGYRLQLMPLLMRYWQRSHPRRRHLIWLRALRRLQRDGEPSPLRLAVLHMDIHRGNVISHQGTLRLIDWEYAGDGDVALELAALIHGNGLTTQQQQRLIATYSARQKIDRHCLRGQIQRWHPWLVLLETSWYELRWQQTGDDNFGALAAVGWQQLSQLN